MRHIAQQPNIRDLILDGVELHLARFGYRKMTMADLASQVGIGKGTLYLHFPSKQELALAHIDRLIERLLQELRAIAATNASPSVRLEAMLKTRVLHRFDSVVHYSQNLNDLLSAVRKELLARRERHFAREAEELAKVVEAGRQRGVFACRDSLKAAEVLVWSTNALLPFSLTAQELGHRDVLTARVSSIAELLLAGLSRGESGAAGAKNGAGTGVRKMAWKPS